MKKSYQLAGRVIYGDQYGRKLGFPTANLDRRDYARRKLKIKFGIYAGRAEFKIKNLKFKIFPAGIIIGPLGSSGLPKIEAYLLNFKGNLYGKQLNIYLNKYLRPFRKFKSEAELKTQIKKDIRQIRKIKSHDWQL